MDSTPIPNPTAHHSHVIASASKLPVKRKGPDSPTLPGSTTAFDGAGDGLKTEARPPPFKFHRIWTEPDEIRFLHGLLDCSSEKLSFPRDLNLFYTRFSNTMSQPFTKSQLSEKLRRLRKKFRVVSARLAKGLDKSLLSPHDRALYDLSEQLWHPHFSETSPFSGSNNITPKKSGLFGVEVSFLPALPCVPDPSGETGMPEISRGSNCDDDRYDNGDDGEWGDVKLKEVNVEFDGVAGKELSGRVEPIIAGAGSEIGEVVGKAVIDALEDSVKEIRRGLLAEVLNLESFQTRWQEQKVAELDVLARRLRMIVQNFIDKQ